MFEDNNEIHTRKRTQVRKRFVVKKLSGEFRAIPDVRKRHDNVIYRRVIYIGPDSPYFKYKDFILGKLVKVIDKSKFGGFSCEFVHDADRKALNMAAGWGDGKKKYLFDSVRLK